MNQCFIFPYYFKTNRIMVTVLKCSTTITSGLTNPIRFFEEDIKRFDGMKAVDIDYVGFCKAFDMVSQGRFIWNVRSHESQGARAIWVRNWLGGGSLRLVVELCLL